MPAVNPDILRWAREAAGLSLVEAAKKIQLGAAYGKQGAQRLSELEAGEEEPSRALIARMAKAYRQPLVAFYLSRPPRPSERGEDFRTHPERHTRQEEALLQALLRKLRAAQSLIRSALLEEGETEPLPFVGSLRRTAGPRVVAESIRTAIGLTLGQFRAARGPREAFETLRREVERSRIFVILAGDLGSYHTALDINTFRGISLADDIAPFVIINPHDSAGALSFSLLHELTHLWLGETGISGGPPLTDLERFCDDVASEFLLPQAEMEALEIERPARDEALAAQVSAFAERRNISSSMVAYRLFRSGSIDFQEWQGLSERFRRLWLDQRERRRQEAREADRTGPNPWVVRQYRISDSLLGLTARLMGTGDLSTSKASIVLGVRPQQVGPLMQAAGVHVGGW